MLYACIPHTQTHNQMSYSQLYHWMHIKTKHWINTYLHVNEWKENPRTENRLSNENKLEFIALKFVELLWIEMHRKVACTSKWAIGPNGMCKIMWTTMILNAIDLSDFCWHMICIDFSPKNISQIFTFDI